MKFFYFCIYFALFQSFAIRSEPENNVKFDKLIDDLIDDSVFIATAGLDNNQLVFKEVYKGIDLSGNKLHPDLVVLGEDLNDNLRDGPDKFVLIIIGGGGDPGNTILAGMSVTADRKIFGTWKIVSMISEGQKFRISTKHKTRVPVERFLERAAIVRGQGKRRVKP